MKDALNPDQIEHECRLFRHLPGVYYVLRFSNQKWEVTHVTQQAKQLFGYTQQEVYSIAGSFLQTVILPEDLQMVIDSKKVAFERERLFNLEFRIRTKAGAIKYVRDQFAVYAVGNDWIMEGYISETFQSNVYDRVLQQLKSYRDAVDVNMISSITDRKGKIVYANENFCRVSKYNMWELIGQNHRIVNSGHHSSDFFKGLWDKISAGNTWHGEILNKAKDGSLYWVDTVIIPIFDESRMIVNYLSLRMLIDERKSAEKDRKIYIHMLEQIAFIVAHNIRGPLCSILGLTNLVSKYKNPEAVFGKAISYLHESAEKLDAITHELSKFVDEHEIEMRLKEYQENG